MGECIVHYENNEDEELYPLTEEHYDRLVSAKNSRLELGGDNVHARQSSNIPEVYPENNSFHTSCYKKFTKAISIRKRKCSTSTSENGRVKRTGELGKKLFPEWCMICKKVVLREKNTRHKPHKLELLSAENAIRAACIRKNDSEMAAAIAGTDSLLAAEFKVHSKCQKEYTRVRPEKPRCQKVAAANFEDYSLRSRSGDSESGSVHLGEQPIEDGNYDENMPLNDAKAEKDSTSTSTETGHENEASVGNPGDVTENLEDISDVIHNDGDDECRENVEDMSEELWEHMDSFEKGDRSKLFLFIEEHLFEGKKCVSVEILTDVFGLDGKDRRARYYVKGIIRERFNDKVLFITTNKKKPQVAAADHAHSGGELLHQSDREEVLRKAAKILREDVDTFIQQEREDQVFPPTYESMKSCRDRYPESLTFFFTQLLKSKVHSITERVQRHVNSYCDDAIHSISKGKIFTLKNSESTQGLL